MDDHRFILNLEVNQAINKMVNNILFLIGLIIFIIGAFTRNKVLIEIGIAIIILSAFLA